jgi:cell wall-associated NlpC family hydrolase
MARTYVLFILKADRRNLMRKLWLFIIALTLGILWLACPAMADNVKDEQPASPSTFFDSDGVTTVEGAVVEPPKRNLTDHRRRSLSSRGGSIISTATRYIGVPYRWAGTTPSGFDCSGFVMTVFGMNGLSIRRMADEQYYGGKKLKRDELEAGDLVFFTTYGPGVTHVGIYMGNEQFIHASSAHGVTISSLNDTYYRNRFIGGCRY